MGLNILFGADYYFSDGIYLGFEAGLGFGTTSFGNHSITTDNLTAFNMYFNNAFTTEGAGAELMGEFVGELPFSALDGVIYNEYYPDGSRFRRPLLRLAEPHQQHHHWKRIPRCIACWILVRLNPNKQKRF